MMYSFLFNLPLPLELLHVDRLVQLGEVVVGPTPGVAQLFSCFRGFLKLAFPDFWFNSLQHEISLIRLETGIKSLV